MPRNNKTVFLLIGVIVIAGLLMALLAFFYLGQTEENQTTNENVNSPSKQAEESNQKPQSEPEDPPNVIVISDSDTAPEPESTTELDCNNPRTPAEEVKCGVIAVNSEQNTDGEPAPEPEPEPEPDPEPEPEPEPAPKLEEEYLIFSGNQFNQVFNEADLANLASIEDITLPVITGAPEIDTRIRKIAEQRGYRYRPEVLDRNQLVFVEGSRHLLQAQAAQAYLELKAAAAEAGHQIHVSSAFRDHDTQRQIFLNHSSEPYTDKDVNTVLKLRSIPGYSKHHTGYTVDLGEGSLTFQTFINSESYTWLAADNYLNAKKHGWIPSYPPDASNQGPDPEPWEFNYVGKEYLLKDSTELIPEA